MLFVSPHPLFQMLGIVQPTEKHHPATGQYMGQEGGIDAEFRHGGAPDWAVEAALANPRFQQEWNSLPDDQDRRTMIGTYDTVKKQKEHGWDDATRELVEETLLNSGHFGQSYIVIEAPDSHMDLPWPNYDSTHHHQVVKVANEIGAELPYVLEYERSHRNRPSVVEQLEKALNVQEDLVVA